jgi:ribosomal protein S18 acetylase RimI-like enzyme
MVTIREIREGDKPTWLELWQGYLDFYQADIPEIQNELTWTRVLDRDFNIYGLVAEIDGAVCGIVHYSFQTSTWAENNYCYLEDLFVDPATRGSGVGRALIDAVRSIAEEAGSSRLYWNTESTNDTARKLYDSFAQESGFVQYRILLP